jgi:acetyl-CoA decarbonylase/synthase complex subunit gamma
LVTIGTGDNAVEVGDETELFRHEKKFFHPSAFVLLIDDTASPDDRKGRVDHLKNLTFDRVGQIMGMDMVGIKATSNDPATFASVVQEVASQTDLPLLLVSENPEVMAEGAKAVADRKPLLHAATPDNYEKMAAVAKENGCSLVVRETSSLDNLADLAEKVKAAGVEDLLLDFGATTLGDMLRNLTIIRRLAVKKKFRPFGYPTFVLAEGASEDAGIITAIGTMKYASVIAFDEARRSQYRSSQGSMRSVHRLLNRQ